MRRKLADRPSRGPVKLSWAEADWLLGYLNHSVACPDTLRPKLVVDPGLVPPEFRLRVKAEVAAAHAACMEQVAAAGGG